MMDVLKREPGLSGVEVDVAGTVRVPSSREYRDKEDKTTDCLVAPDGTIEECRLLFNFAAEAAQHLPDFNFAFRLHPLVSVASLVKLGIIPEELSSNLELSEQSLICDLNRSRTVLYRSSSVAATALYTGLRPIYFDPPGHTNIDILFGLKNWKVSASSVQVLREILLSDRISKSISLQAEWAKTQGFRNDYMHSFDATAFLAHQQ